MNFQLAILRSHLFTPSILLKPLETDVNPETIFKYIMNGRYEFE